MDQLHFLPPRAATTTRRDGVGKLLSYQKGKPPGNCTMIYSCKAKRIAQKKPWKGKEGIRVERRLRYLNVKLGELPSLANPFKGLEIIHKDLGPPAAEAKPWVWELTLDAAEKGGLGPALAKLPQKKRPMYRKHLKANVVPWWQTEELWAGWQLALAELKIADKQAWF